MKYTRYKLTVFVKYIAMAQQTTVLIGFVFPCPMRKQLIYVQGQIINFTFTNILWTHRIAMRPRE